MYSAAAWFCAGFLIAQSWAFYLFREVLSGVDADYVRLVSIVALETAVAAVAFLIGVRAGRATPSRSAWPLAFIAGFVMNTITVGAYPMLPRADAWQIEIGALAIAVLAVACGWLLPRLLPRVQRRLQ